MDRQALAREIVRCLAEGKIESRLALPALQQLLAEEASRPGPAAVLDALDAHDDPAVRRLAAPLEEARQRDVLRYRNARRSGLAIGEAVHRPVEDLPLGAPDGWTKEGAGWEETRAALVALADFCFISPHREKAPTAAAEVEKKLRTLLKPLPPLGLDLRRAAIDALLPRTDGDLAAALARLRETVVAARLADDSKDETVALERLRADFFKVGDRGREQAILDEVCSWPSPRAAGLISTLASAPWARRRAALILALRFGEPVRGGWDNWIRWLDDEARRDAREGERAESLVAKSPGSCLLLDLMARPDADPQLVAQLQLWCEKQGAQATAEDFLDRWSWAVSSAEWSALSGEEVRHESDSHVRVVQRHESDSQDRVVSRHENDSHIRVAPRPAPAPVPAPPPPRPSVWEAHLKPFFIENWYMAAGVVMVLVGASILAYFTWDKHWLVRYTLMPSVLGLFTAGLAWMGTWIERRDTSLRDTGAVLRGAAIGLLPANCMAVALLARDPGVTLSKTLAVPLMGALYLGLFGWGLVRWCGGVHASLGRLLGGTLLALNGLVMLAPLAQSLAKAQGQALYAVVGTGFYLGFFAAAAATLHFARRVMTPDLAKERRVPWFFGLSLSITLFQVFAWVHGYLRHLPQVHTYGPMLILAGAMVFLLERRAKELRGENAEPGAESFIGYTLVLLGLLMGLGHESLRIVSFLLAGKVWLVQAAGRRHPAQTWIGLLLLVMGVASVALLEGFPSAWIPGLGLATALGLGALALWAGGNLGQAAAGLQVVLLFATVAAAVLVPAVPIVKAGWIAAVALCFGFRGWRTASVRSIQTAMVLLAAALPWAGCVDLARGTLQGNTIAFGLAGLSALWIALNLLARRQVLLDARSTVLMIYGALAIAAMVVRLFLDPKGVDPYWYRAWMDYTGPLAIAAVLVYATWTSRSLIPAIMAMAIAVVLLPEMRANLDYTFERLELGSGLGSAITAPVLVLVAFALRGWKALALLEGGDRYLGRAWYPLHRTDHTLFTWPILASAAFLIAKVDTVLLVKHLVAGMKVKTAVALLLSGFTWTLLAVYFRAWRGAVLGTHLGWITAALGLGFLLPMLQKGLHWSMPILAAGILFQALEWFYASLRRPWVEPLLAAPMRLVLREGSLVVAAVAVVALLAGAPVSDLWPLMVFMAWQHARHGLATRGLRFGSALYVLAVMGLLAWTRRGPGELLTVEHSLEPLLWFLASVQLVHVALEFRRSAYAKLVPLLGPFQAGTTAITLVLGLAGIAAFYVDADISFRQQLLILAAVLLAARAHACGMLALIGATLGWLALHHDVLQKVDVFKRVVLLSEPWRPALFALMLASLAAAGRWLHARRPALLSSPLAPGWIKWPVLPWFLIPAILFSIFAAIGQVVGSSWAGASYVAAAAMGVVGTTWNRRRYWAIAGVMATLGNIHVLRLIVGSRLDAWGMSEVHLVGLGVAASLLQITGVRALLRSNATVVESLNRASLVGAGFILVLLSANYFVHPDLALISWSRFAVSGAMSLLAGLYFRRAARRPSAGEEAWGGVAEGFYHFGLTMAIWCAALMVPALRHPVTALIALGVPVLYFYARAEDGWRRGVDTHARYRMTAAVLGFLVLALYAFRPFAQLAIFSNTNFDLTYYHRNSPVIFALSAILLRLHALGGTGWLAFYGGLAMMGSAYFAVTAVEGLSPFTHPAPAAWAALAMAHFWTLASASRSPLRTAIERLARLDTPAWLSLRRSWGVWLLVASQGAALWGMLNAADTRFVAPLLVGAASVFVHQGVHKGSAAYHVVGGALAAVALHLDFVLPSYLPKQHVVWVVVGLWAALLVLQQWRAVPGVGRLSLLMGGAALGHVLWHGPWTGVGLGAFACAVLLALAVPRSTRAPMGAVEQAVAAILPWTPVWLVYFGFSPFGREGLGAVFHTIPALASAAALLAVGVAARVLEERRFRGWTHEPPRVLDQVVAWLRESGGAIHTATLSVATLIAFAVQVARYGRAFDPAEIGLLTALWAALGAGWFFEGRARRSTVAFVLLELCALMLLAAVRRQLLLTTPLWRVEYDVLAALGLSAVLSGLRQDLDRLPREARGPLLVTLYVLPVVTLGWVLLRGMGPDLALVVVGLQSAMFAYMGRGAARSAHHAVATAGAVAFTLILFWSKLHLRVVQAYVVPVGCGILVLLQLFGRRMEPELRNGVRLVTLLGMLGSSAYYALVDDRYPVGFNLTMIALSLLAMGLGGWLRIRLYVILGFAGLMVDLASIVVKVLGRMDRNVRMTAVGSLVLVVGAALVFGAIYYKTHRKEVGEVFGRLRVKLASWE